MDACVRGFSFMPETKIDVMELQYIEGGELERNWKASRRERLREREQRIWKEFVVNEQDVLNTFCKDDPYQFLEQLPQNEIEEMLQIELQKMKPQEDDVTDVIVTSNEDTDSAQEMAVVHTVMFADGDENDDCEMFHIFDDDKDGEISAPEDEGLNNSIGSLDTVREKPPDLSPAALPSSPDKVSSKSSENVNNIIENSIYCEKVKDLRLKLSEESMEIVAFLEHRDVMNIDPEDMAKMCRRSAEFNARFNRNHLYQLQRQINDVKRNNALSLPFAKHTHFQSQMTRITSLHQNMLQSFQVFHKSLQTACAGESVAALRSLIETCREATLVSRDASAPYNFTAAKDLFADNLLETCDRLQATAEEYATKLTNYVQTTENANDSHSKTSSKMRKEKKRSLGTGSKSAGADARLSMYSLDTVRLNTTVKSTSSKECHSSGTSKMGGGCTRGRAANQHSGVQPKSRKKSPRSRRPLMRGPQSRRSPRSRRRLPQDNDIQTMVQAVDVVTCTSSHVSRDVTPDPPTRRKEVTPRQASKETTPRNVKCKETTPRKPFINTPRGPQTTPREPQSPNSKNAKVSPKNPNNLKNDVPKIKDTLPSSGIKDIPKALKSLKNDTLEIQKTTTNNPVIKIQSAKKDEGLSGNDKAKINNDSVKEGRMDRNEAPRRGKCEGEYKGRMERENVLKVDEETTDKESNKAAIPARCEVTRILRQLCGGDAPGSRNDRSSGAKNAQLLCIKGGSPRQPSTPQLLRILEETIQKKVPKPLFVEEPTSHKDAERYRLLFNIPEGTTDRMFQYRTKFVQHMLRSPMYANSVIGKPWEVIGRISDAIIDDLLLACANQMELPEVVQKLYDQETH